MFSVPKKQKLNKDSGRIFQERWTTEFGVIEKNNKALCCLSSETVVSRTFNVKRHLEKNHKNVCSMSNKEESSFHKKSNSTQNKQVRLYLLSGQGIISRRLVSICRAA
jgi:hypothetical protein